MEAENCPRRAIAMTGSAGRALLTQRKELPCCQETTRQWLGGRSSCAAVRGSVSDKSQGVAKTPSGMKMAAAADSHPHVPGEGLQCVLLSNR